MKRNETRTGLATKNVVITTLSLLLYYVVSFVCRTIFTNLLGEEYLGIQGLFSNVLMMLSFAELGMGEALVFLFYEPLYKNDKKQLIIRMGFCKKVYRYICGGVALLGIILLPFLKYLLRDAQITESTIVIYCLYVLNNILSYVCIYKRTILLADQKQYIVTFYTQIFNILMNIFQIVVLLLFNNFLLYLVIMNICTLLNNIVCSYRASKEYPFIDQKTTLQINKEEKKKFIKSVKGLFLGRISLLSFDATDNIFISAFSGIKMVGILSQYTLITVTLNTFINQIVTSITASIGNLGIEASTQKKKDIFDKLHFLNAFMYGYFCLLLALLLQDFVTKIWLTNDYFLEKSSVLLLLLVLYLKGEDIPLYIFRNALGNFSQLKWINVMSGMINLILDFALIQKFGVGGVFLATIIAQTIYRYADVLVVFVLDFKDSVWHYFKLHIKWSTLMIFDYILLNIIFNNIVIQNDFLAIIIKGILGSCIYLLSVVILWRKSFQYKYFKNFVTNELQAFFNKRIK